MALYTVNASQVVSSADVNQLVNLLNGATTNTQATVSNRIRAQLTGATSGSGGYCGQVAGAAPTTGTFVAGDFVIDGTLGSAWVCLTGGSPGTWGMLPAQIAMQNLTTTTASVTFSGIPAGFNNLMVVWRARASDAVPAEPLYLRLNGTTTASYLWEVNQANNATVAGTTSGAATNQIQIGTIAAGNATANYFSSGTFTISGVSDTTDFATVVGTGTAYAATNNMWTGTYGGMYGVGGSVISSITLFGATGSLVAGSRFTLYGMQ